MRASTLVASIALLAGGAVAQASTTPPPNTTVVSQTTYNNIIKYSQYAAAAYADTCNTPPNSATILQYFNVNTTDTQATLFRNANSKEIILAFRGTSTPLDASTDFNYALTKLNIVGTSCANCSVHSGFQKAYNSVATSVISAVKSALSSNPGYTFTLTGHSLGGGLAALATPSLVGSGVKIANVYTYGEPRNGNPAWGDYVEKVYPNATYFRVTHSNDGVPHIPPPFFGYRHHGTEYWQSQLAFNNTAATTFRCPGVENPNCNAKTLYQDSAINLAHITYSNGLIGQSLYIAACGDTTS